MVDIEKLVKKWEKDYQEEKNKEAEDLHNTIAQVLADKKATVQTTLYVLKMIEFELLRAKYEQLMGHAIVPLGGGVKKDAKLQTDVAEK